MGFHILLVAFAVVIVGGMGNLTGTFISAFVLGLVIAITARFWSQAADTMVFAVMALVLLKNSLLALWRRLVGAVVARAD
jgi:branched-subunit amino acid ABC-type transport system permease component